MPPRHATCASVGGVAGCGQHGWVRCGGAALRAVVGAAGDLRHALRLVERRRQQRQQRCGVASRHRGRHRLDQTQVALQAGKPPLKLRELACLLLPAVVAVRGTKRAPRGAPPARVTTAAGRCLPAYPTRRGAALRPSEPQAHPRALLGVQQEGEQQVQFVGALAPLQLLARLVQGF
jgi:hypothetical protein